MYVLCTQPLTEFGSPHRLESCVAPCMKGNLRLRWYIQINRQTMKKLAYKLVTRPATCAQLKSTLLTTPYDVLPTQGGQSVSVVQSASTPPPRSRSPSPFNSSSEMLLKKSRKQRMSSIPPPAPSPTNMSAKPPIAGYRFFVVFFLCRAPKSKSNQRAKVSPIYFNLSCPVF